MELTKDNTDYLNKPALGYMVNTLFSDSARTEVAKLQAALVAEFPDVLDVTPTKNLHITLMDWLAPLVEYSDDKDILFKELEPGYNDALERVLENIKPIQLNFQRLIVSSAAIAVVANEEEIKLFNQIRRQFLERVELLPGTKLPPNIVHCTIGRFVGEVTLDRVKQFTDSQSFSFQETIDSFQLVRESVVPMVDFSVLKTYSLS